MIRFLERVVEPALSAALNTFWQAALLALLVWAILRFVPRMNASTRHAVWWASLAALLLLPAASTLVRPRQRAAVVNPGTAFSEPFAVAPRAPISPIRESVPVKVRAGWLPALVLGAWLIAVLIQFARIAWSYAYLRGITRRSRPAGAELRSALDACLAQCRIGRRIPLLVSGEIASPMAAGFLHPVVILPESLAGAFEESELEYVLLHELAHVARRDNWTNLAARVAAAFVVLHPVALWILHRIERERELACDDWVVSLSGQARPYANTLARLFEVCAARRRVLLATGMAGPASQLGERIEGLLRGRDFTPRASLIRVALCAVFVLTLTAAGTLAPRWIAFARDAQPAPQQAPRAPLAPLPRRMARPVPVEAPEAQSQERSATPANNGLLATLVAAGYGDLSVDEIISLKNAGVSPAFLLGMRDSGWGKPAPARLIQLWQNGVSADYATQMGDAGVKHLALEEVVRLRQQGVRPEFASSVHALGFGPFTAQEMIGLSTNGVSLESLRALKEAGLTGALASEIIQAHQAGLREADVRHAKQFGDKLTLEQILKLKRGGVL